jgi:hypothetical protein
MVALAARAEGYGRWQMETQTCELRRPPSRLTQPCSELRLEQNLEGLLSVRFIAAGQGDLIAREHLLFAGVLDPDQPAMRCRQDGRCEPQWPTSLVVASVADVRFDDRGLARGLPRTHLARGRCALSRRSVRCEASDRSGEQWLAEAEL